MTDPEEHPSLQPVLHRAAPSFLVWSPEGANPRGLYPRSPLQFLGDARDGDTEQCRRAGDQEPLGGPTGRGGAGARARALTSGAGSAAVTRGGGAVHRPGPAGYSFKRRAAYGVARALAEPGPGAA